MLKGLVPLQYVLNPFIIRVLAINDFKKINADGCWCFILITPAVNNGYTSAL